MDGIVDKNIKPIGFDFISVNSNENSNATIKWNTKYVKENYIYVFVYPNNEIEELKENNNMEEKKLPKEIYEKHFITPSEGEAKKELGASFSSTCLLIIAFPIIFPIIIYIIFAHWLSKRLK